MSSSPAEKCTDLSEGGAEWRWWRELTGVEGAHRRGGVRLGQLVASCCRAELAAGSGLKEGGAGASWSGGGRSRVEVVAGARRSWSRRIKRARGDGDGNEVEEGKKPLLLKY